MKCSQSLLCLSGCSPESDDGSARRLIVLKHIIDLFQTVNLSTEITTELTGLLLNEVNYLCFDFEVLLSSAIYLILLVLHIFVV